MLAKPEPVALDAEGARFENPDALETIGRDLLSSDQFG